MKKLLLTIFLILITLTLKPHEHAIVFIHGTIGPLSSFPTSIQELKEIFGRTNKTEQTKLSKNIFSKFYQRHINQCRFDGLHKYQPISDFNLIKFGEGKNKKQLKIFEQLFKQSFQKIKSKKDKYVFYTFGWDGRLDAKKRKKWGYILYKQLIKEFKNKSIQIYAHSHGGNVALYLADAEKKYKQNLKIENLVFLGLPIQKESEKLIKSNIFKKIYNVYSENDYMQTLENKLSRKNKGNRRFSETNTPSNLKQIEVEVKKQKPSHWELWYYGKSNINLIQSFIYHKIMYNPKFELYPYPISIFLPQIINQIENNKKLKNKRTLYLNIKKNIQNDKFEIKIRLKQFLPIQLEFN